MIVSSVSDPPATDQLKPRWIFVRADSAARPGPDNHLLPGPGRGDHLLESDPRKSYLIALIRAH